MMYDRPQLIHIPLSRYFERQIAERESVNSLFASYKYLVTNKNQPILLQIDFSDIEFISRSAAHQFLKEIENLLVEHNHVSINFKNRMENIEHMFKAVSYSNRENRRRPDIAFVNNEIDLRSFLVNF